MNKNFMKMPWLMLCVTLLVACAGTPDKNTGADSYPATLTGIKPSSDLQQRLVQHAAAWRGTPYRMGGLNRNGVDCSGFVYITYRDVFGMRLPRSTEQLADMGTAVGLDQLSFGDLLIFKTGFKQKHVGVYVGEGVFVHASSSRGVMVSHINSPYWADAYRQTRRVASFY